MPLKLIKKPNLSARRRRVKEARRKFFIELTKKVKLRHLEYVADWDEPPTFRQVYGQRGKSAQVTVVKNKAGIKWRIVNYGSGEKIGKSAYTIRPKKPGGVLRITLGYTPHTTRKSHGGPGEYAGPVIFRKKAVIKGIDPRDFIGRANKDVVLSGDALKLLVSTYSKAIYGR